MVTYKTKLIFPSEQVRSYWLKNMLIVRDCYNFSAKIVFDENLKHSLKEYHRRLYRAEREAFPQLPAQMCIKVIRQILANYRTVRANKVKLEKPLEMKNPSVMLDKRLYSRMTRESFSLSNGDGKRRSDIKFVLYPKFNEIAERYRMCDPTLQYDEREDVFYACIPFLVLSTTPRPESFIGVDLGMKRIATLSDGTAITDKSYLERRRKIRHNKRVFRRHKKNSHSARRKLNALRRKERNMCRDFCHRVANEILNHEGSTIVLEDLSLIKQSTSKTNDGRKRKSHNNALSQAPFFQLRQILTYKAPLRGKQVATVNPQYTSKEDCRKRSSDGCVRQGCRFYTADGFVFDADWNAAINILNRHHPSSFNLPIDGRLNLIGRRRQHANRGSTQVDLQAQTSSVAA